MSDAVIDKLKEMKNPYAGMSHEHDVYDRAMNDAIKVVQEVFDEYGNYKYPTDVKLDTPNDATTSYGKDDVVSLGSISCGLRSVEEDEEQVETGQKGSGHVDVLSGRLAQGVAAVDRIGGCKNCCTCFNYRS